MKRLCFVIIVLMFSGCATATKTWLDTLDAQAKLVDTQIAQIPTICRIAQWDRGWMAGSGIIPEGEMSANAMAAMKRLDELCAKPNPTVSEMGFIAAAAWRAWADRIAAALLKYRSNGRIESDDGGVTLLKRES